MVCGMTFRLYEVVSCTLMIETPFTLSLFPITRKETDWVVGASAIPHPTHSELTTFRMILSTVRSSLLALNHNRQKLLIPINRSSAIKMHTMR